jgi:hypothetical protein
VGTVVLSRDETPIGGRVHLLWLLLGGAALLALVVGALVGRLLGRWIATLRRSLVAAAESVGAGSLTARAETNAYSFDARSESSARKDVPVPRLPRRPAQTNRRRNGAYGRGAVALFLKRLFCDWLFVVGQPNGDSTVGRTIRVEMSCTHAGGLEAAPP